MAALQGATAVAVIALACLVPRSDTEAELGIGFVLIHLVVAVVAVADLRRR